MGFIKEIELVIENFISPLTPKFLKKKKKQSPLHLKLKIRRFNDTLLHACTHSKTRTILKFCVPLFFFIKQEFLTCEC